jgi:uncharacterized protein involved in cysteine biosynthesis
MGSLFTPGMLGVFVWSILLTIAALTGFVLATSALFAWLAVYLQHYAFAAYLPWLGSIGSAAIAWLLFPGITPIIISFFDLRITRLIEQHEYPAAPQPMGAPFLPEFLHDVRFALFAIFLNILVLPLYLLPGLNLVLFYLLNGYLLGREYFVMVARRHMPVIEAEALRRRHGRVVLSAGVLLTLMATIPFVNLVAPFWGVAVMVHLYHKVQGTPDSRLLPPQGV